MKLAHRLAIPVFLVCLLISAGLTGTAFTQTIDDNVQQQIKELLQEKDGRTAGQRKISSRLIYAMKAARGERLTPSIDAMPDALGGIDVDKGVLVDIRGTVSDDLEMPSRMRVVQCFIALAGATRFMRVCRCKR